MTTQNMTRINSFFSAHLWQEGLLNWITFRILVAWISSWIAYLWKEINELNVFQQLFSNCLYSLCIVWGISDYSKENFPVERVMHYLLLSSIYCSNTMKLLVELQRKSGSKPDESDVFRNMQVAKTSRRVQDKKKRKSNLT